MATALRASPRPGTPRLGHDHRDENSPLGIINRPGSAVFRRRRRRKRLFLGAGIVAAFLLSPVFWLLPNRTASVGNVFVQTLPFPYWTLGAWNGPEFVYNRGDPFMFSHRKVYMKRSVCCGTLLISIRGRQVPDMWA